MDFCNTRIAVRRQVDSATRKRLGLSRPSPVRVSAAQRSTPYSTWKDAEIKDALDLIATHYGCKIRSLKLSDYRNFQDANRSLAPSLNTIKARLARGIPDCPRKLK